MLPRTFAPLFLALPLMACQCGKDVVAPTEAGILAPMTSPTTPTAGTGAASAPPTSAPPAATAPARAPDIPARAALEKELRAGLPAGSGDYAGALALATLHKRGTIAFEQLEAAVLALSLPPHKLGDGYLMVSAPPPPPTIKFDPKMMPKDWEGTWGEVAMAYHLGILDKDTYNKLHRAAHPTGCNLK